MRLYNTVFFLLLIYIVAILIFWGISLQKQNERIYGLESIVVSRTIDSVQHPALYQSRVTDLERSYTMRVKQFVGEGGTFLLVILIGAGVVWTSLRRSMRLSRQQSNFMLSVTHELKSPIAAIKLNLQTLERHSLDTEKRDMLIERCIKEANRLNDLCNNMLFASQIEGRQYAQAKETLNFSELVEDSVEDYANRYPQRFEEEITPGCKITGDRVMLQMAVNNLLENAVKYAPDKLICVKLELQHGILQLQIIDEGPGITEDEKKKIFNKFYRVGREESRKAKGTGLGLYLTCKIVSQHKGKIQVKDNKPTGSIFEICLPAA